MKMIFGLLLMSAFTHAGECFNLTFCSTGAAPRYILCSRGHDCSQAKDLGLQFKSDCTVSRWLGDAMMTQKYLISGKVLKVLKDNETETYQLSSNGQSITSLENAKHVLAVDACQQVK